jgi:5'-3' exonuclease
MRAMPELVTDSRPVLLIDGPNVFIRCFAAYPSMSTNGAQMGGAVGFVKTMRGIIDLLQPKRVIVAWEGGGSARRRALYSEYKQNRRPTQMRIGSSRT